ncbi:diacylglycerol kinase family lipid kinase [Kitasatospora sp. NBC_01287]|uniref:diacylglycerol/lipid kinase family protein n=1 Tax=Kitasatospora sp. NBC_01287 TaxID=2903573 RepID=UPI002250B86F|nr:diacylglycerol kinase family protein [Kitasatospora sp. NBC_01287]MCX4745611.1 diacylglycerol kinase family lipid kinase [Kitasatospora sp. NBC_01287]
MAAGGFTAIVNPISGGGHAAARWEPIAARLRAGGATVRSVPTRGRDHAIASAREAAERGEVVVAVGGDGMVRDVAEGAVRGAGTMAVVPAGRGNDLARTLRLPGVGDPAAVADLLLAGRSRTIDVLEVNGVVVPGNVYIGIDALATQIINAGRALPALLVYRLAPLQAILRWRAAGYTLTVDGERREVRGHTVVVANSGAYGHGLRIVPTALLDDGLLDVMVVGDGPRAKVVSFMREAKRGTHLRRPEVSVRPAREVVVDADRAIPVCADGDEIAELPARIKVLPGALRILVP